MHRNFIDLPMKTSLKGWHKSWFYCENHELCLPPFVGQFPEYDGTWVEEPTTTEKPLVTGLANQVSELKELGLTGVSMAANWLVHRVTPLKKQVHSGWEYSGTQDLSWEMSDNLTASKIVELLQEMF
jgi:hypothetical protein